MIDQGILVEGEPLPSKEGGGKPARPIWFAEDAAPICAVLLMHDGVHCCLVSLDGTITAEVRATFPEDAATVEPLIDILFDCVGQVLDLAHRPPLGIGVAAGGMIDTDTGTIVAVNLAPLLDGFPLGQALARRFGLPVRVDHHPRALLVGDRWFGIGRGKPNFAVIYTGDVLGGAIFLDGHLYRGPAGAGGELGHTFVQVDGATCRCGRRGCWETIATLGWLRREALQRHLPSCEAMDSRSLALLAMEMAARQPASSTSMPATSPSVSPIFSRPWRRISSYCTATWWAAVRPCWRRSPLICATSCPGVLATISNSSWGTSKTGRRYAEPPA